jgi:hypothetical protein
MNMLPGGSLPAAITSRCHHELMGLTVAESRGFPGQLARG